MQLQLQLEEMTSSTITQTLYACVPDKSVITLLWEALFTNKTSSNYFETSLQMQGLLYFT